MSAADDQLNFAISPLTLRFPVARMEHAFQTQNAEAILDGLPAECMWLLLGSALGHANFVVDAFSSEQASAAVVPPIALGLAFVVLLPLVCAPDALYRAPRVVLLLLASCSTLLLLASPVATSVLCTDAPCGTGAAWRLAAAAQDALLVVAVLSALLSGLPVLYGSLPPFVAAVAQVAVLVVRRDVLYAEQPMACLRRGSSLLVLLKV